MPAEKAARRQLERRTPVTLACVIALVGALLPGSPHPQAAAQNAGEVSCPVAASPEAFADRDDIPAPHVASVDCAAFFEIALGFADHTYRPTLSVRRDQMASFIARTLDAADVTLPPAGDAPDFADVAADSPHREAIRRLAAAGIVLGGPHEHDDEEYGPELATRRDQMTSFVIRAGEYAYGEVFESSVARFPDVSKENVHFAHINFAAEHQAVLGFDASLFDDGPHFDEPFHPRLPTRRDQMATFVVRFLRFLAAPVDVEITDPSAETATVDETTTVTAAVFTQFRGVAGQDARFRDGEDVTFRVAAETGTVTPSEQTVESDEDGLATLSFTPHETGTVSVTASVPGPGGQFAGGDGDRDTVERHVGD